MESFAVEVYAASLHSRIRPHPFRHFHGLDLQGRSRDYGYLRFAVDALEHDALRATTRSASCSNASTAPTSVAWLRLRLRKEDPLQVLVLNPGGNSLKVEIVSCNPGQQHAFEGEKRISLSIEEIGKSPRLLHYRGKETVASEPIEAEDYGQAAANLFAWFDSHRDQASSLDEVDCVGVRVVHGGPDLTAPALISSEVERQIVALEKLAPLHNKSSIEVLEPVRQRLGQTPVYGVFDTAFHRTMPDYASTYAIPYELSTKHQIRRYGFHGISHRYLLERYAHLVGKNVERCSIVSMHLESGCSVTAVQNGKSIDNTMGLTPLEGLMMGTRSGDLDPSILPLLVKEEGMTLDEVMTMLNKKSGLLGVSGKTLDTRILMPEYDKDERVKLAIDIFAYRLLKALGAYLAALGSEGEGAEAIVFGGGIAENNTLVRQRIGDHLRCFGLDLDPEANERLVNIEGRLSTKSSKVQAWVIPTEEGLQIAHECCLAAN